MLQGSGGRRASGYLCMHLATRSSAGVEETGRPEQQEGGDWQAVGGPASAAAAHDLLLLATGRGAPPATPRMRHPLVSTQPLPRSPTYIAEQLVLHS